MSTPGRVDDAADHVEQRLADVARAAAAARPAAGRTARAPRTSTARRRASSSASLRAGSSAGSMPSAISISWSAIVAASLRPRRPASSARPPAEQAQVARADRPARTGEQGEQRRRWRSRRAAGRAWRRPRRPRAAGAARRGRRSRPGCPAPVRASKTVLGVGVVAGEHADVGPGLGSGVVGRLDRVGQPGQLVGVRLVDARRDDALARVAAWRRAGATLRRSSS